MCVKGQQTKGCVASRRPSVSVLVSQRRGVDLWGGAVNKSTRAPTGRGSALAAGMADANGDGHADVWERLRGARLSRDV